MYLIKNKENCVVCLTEIYIIYIERFSLKGKKTIVVFCWRYKILYYFYRLISRKASGKLAYIQ